MLFFLGTHWEMVDPVVADPVAQDNNKRNSIQIDTEIPFKVLRGRGQNFPIFISCRYLVELGPRQLGLPVAEQCQQVVWIVRDYGSSKTLQFQAS